MRRHLGKARYASILLLAIATVVLFLRLQFVNDGQRRAAAMFPAPTAGDFATALIRAGLDPQALAAAGASGAAVQVVVDNVEAYLIAHPEALELADGARAQTRVKCNQLTRVIQSGTATAEQIQALPAARANLALAEGQLQGLLNDVFNAGTATLPQSQRAKLAAIRANRAWDMPVEFLLADRPQADWVSLRECLANERISGDLGETPDPGAQAMLQQLRSDPVVATARANIDTGLETLAAAWQQAVNQ